MCLLHGWALNLHVWDHITESLEQAYQVTRIDLPGHGKSAPINDGDFTLDSVAEIIAGTIEQDTMLAGWSLGGLVAIKLAQLHPQLIKKLVLVASSPQFASADSWSHGIKKTIIEGFAKDLKDNYRETIMRFIALQTFGSEQAKPVVRELRNKVFASGEPHLESLFQGLKILQNAKLWGEAREISCPTLILLGEKDTLIPEDSGIETQNAIPGSQLEIIKGAGHAPFLSHPREFNEIVNRFLKENNNAE